MDRGPLARLADALARISSRWVPDAFSIAALLTFVTLALARGLGRADLAGCVRAWGDGVWTLLPFSMQIAVVIFAGYVLAVSPLVRALLDALASVPRTPRQAAAWTALLSMLLCWLNWGMGLIASAVLVRAVARRRPEADYRVLVAVAYLGLGTTWHGGPSGSVPLLLATPDSFMIKAGLITSPVPLADTIFTATNVGLMVLVTLGLAAFAGLLHPSAVRTVRADPAALGALESFEPPRRPASPTPAERLMHGPWLNGAMGLLGLAYLGSQAWAGRFVATLDTVNLVVLTLALLAHPSPASLVRAAEDASRPLHGVVLQFPLYAGVYGIIKDTGLADALAQAFVSVATPRTFPFVVFCYSAVLNYWVPSGGAKWAMEAEYLLRAAGTLGVGTPAVVMAYAYGDMATNLIQPFWAIPILAVTRLRFGDILGYTGLVAVICFIVTVVAMLIIPATL
ncbi:MAG: short-chain fatty acid transporter [Acidobacteria bacterium]|nr:short-chain fatty acid transporter [Acidobacteriota bacterium]